MLMCDGATVMVISSYGVADFLVDGVPQVDVAPWLDSAPVSLKNGFSSIRLWASCSITHCATDRN